MIISGTIIILLLSRVVLYVPWSQKADISGSQGTTEISEEHDVVISSYTTYSPISTTFCLNQ
jgi:hypothetical protein